MRNRELSVIFLISILFLYSCNTYRRHSRKVHYYFIGTSFTRELYFSALRDLLNVDKLSDEQKYIPSYQTNSGNCNLPGKAGVDTVLCGYPGFATTVVGDVRLTFQFKTYLSTKESDKKSLDNLLGIGDDIDVFVLGSSEWGRNMYIDDSYEKQVRDFFETFITHVDARFKIFYYNKGYNKSTKYMYDLYSSLQDFCIIDNSVLKSEAIQMRVRLGHGLSPYVTDRVWKYHIKHFNNVYNDYADSV